MPLAGLAAWDAMNLKRRINTMSLLHVIRCVSLPPCLRSWGWWGVMGLLLSTVTISWRGAACAGRVFVYPVTQETTYRHMADSYVKQYCPLEYAALEAFQGEPGEYESIKFVMQDAAGRRVLYLPGMMYSGVVCRIQFFFDAATPERVCIHAPVAGVLHYQSFLLTEKENMAVYLQQAIQRYAREHGMLHSVVLELVPEPVDMRLAPLIELMNYLVEQLPYHVDVGELIPPVGDGPLHYHW